MGPVYVTTIHDHCTAAISLAQSERWHRLQCFVKNYKTLHASCGGSIDLVIRVSRVLHVTSTYTCICITYTTLTDVQAEIKPFKGLENETVLTEEVGKVVFSLPSSRMELHQNVLIKCTMNS